MVVQDDNSSSMVVVRIKDRDLSIQGSVPKRKAVGSNPARDANPPKTLRFRGIPFPKTSSVELRFIIPCNAYYRCIYI